MKLLGLALLAILAGSVVAQDGNVSTVEPTPEVTTLAPVGSDSPTNPQCDNELFRRVVTTSANGERCRLTAGYPPYLIPIPTGDLLKTVCLNGACQVFFKEMAAAFPTDCDDPHYGNVHVLYTTVYPAACAAAVTDPSLTPPPNSGASPIALLCDKQLFDTITATSSNARQCTIATGLLPSVPVNPTGARLKAVCQNAACQAFFKEMAAAFPIDCATGRLVNLHTLYTTEYEAACAAVAK